jgi:hypothetical protein
MRWLFVSFAMGLAFSSGYITGEKAGVRHGYAECVAEEDGDTVRNYSEVLKQAPKL